MKYLIYLLGIIFLLGLNVGLFTNLQIKGQVPNLLFLLVLFFALDKDSYDFFFVGFVTGIFLDFYSPGFFGGYTITFLLLALIVRFLADNVMFSGANWKTMTVLLIGSLAFLDSSLWLYQAAAFRLGGGVEYTAFGVYVRSFIPELFYDLLFLFPIYAFFIFLKNSSDRLIFRRRGSGPLSRSLKL